VPAIQNTLGLILKFVRLFFTLLSRIAGGFWEWCGDYSGFGALWVKWIPDAIKAIIVGEPVWLYLIVLLTSLNKPLSIQYLLYSLWVAHFIVIVIAAGVVAYLRKH